MRTAALMLTVSVAAIAMPALAQETAPAATPAAPEEATGEIVVTATRRSEALSNVPLAVSAVTAQSLANSGASDIRQLNQLAPSLLVSSTGTEANGSARIRGIGTVGDNPGLESSVAVFIDGVYRSRSGIGLNELGEIERVEVLRGPQGTLFGRNASAGLIHVISKAPEFNFGATAEATYGNYDFLRLSGGVTGPISDTLAARVDGVYVRRDGFLRDPRNGYENNNRDRYFVRGQLLFKPNEDVRFRLIGDYTRRKEACCGAVYVSTADNPFIGGLNDPAQNNIVRVLQDLGTPPAAFSNPYSRNSYVNANRDFTSTTTDGGVSGELTWNLGGATLTSITAYREYKSGAAGDIDYSPVDILYRGFGGQDASYRKFRTFTQELRLQGSAFDDRVDWLVGGYFANERLDLTDNLRFGAQYGRFATCRIVSGGLAALYNAAGQACLSPAGRFALANGLTPLGVAGGNAVLAGLDRLDTLNDRGSTLDTYRQRSRNWAIFTHNIFKITDQLSLTLGARYTNENKRLNATFGNDNTVCTANQAALGPLLATPLAATAGAIIGLSCQGNSTAELNGQSLASERSEDRITGTAVLSYKATPDLLVYGSFSRGYKAGGFNLDRSALKSPIATFASLGGPQALARNLQFDPEIVDAFELGFKYSTRKFSLNVAAFRQQFKNFQLNTFNGAVFLVQNVNGCRNSLGGGDRDALAGTGACDASAVGYGVKAEGVEIESSFRPVRYVNVGLGLTVANTRYRDQLVGTAAGTPLDPALRVLPGKRLSNAPGIVATGSLAWTPPLGDTGLSGLVYVDARMTSDYNTGSDLFPQKAQDGYAVVNGRVGLRGPDQRWAIELWAQNLFNQNYSQVAFNSPFQAGATSAPFTDANNFPGGRQIFSMFLAEPRTYGVTARVKF